VTTLSLDDEFMVEVVPGRGPTIRRLVQRFVCGLHPFQVRFSIGRVGCEDIAYPISLETILGAEVTVLDALLQTRWALQSSSCIIAISPRAPCLGHCRDGL